MPRKNKGNGKQRAESEGEEGGAEGPPAKKARAAGAIAHVTRAERGLPTGVERQTLVAAYQEMRHRLAWLLLTAAGWTERVKIESKGDCWLIAARLNGENLAAAAPEEALKFGGDLSAKRGKLTANRIAIADALSGVGYIFAKESEVEKWADLPWVLGPSTTGHRRTVAALKAVFDSWKAPLSWSQHDVGGAQVLDGPGSESGSACSCTRTHTHQCILLATTYCPS